MNSEIQQVFFNGLGGDDLLVNSTNLPAWMNGGDGADTLIGGSGNDTFLGEGGDDQFFGNLGNDMASGGDGNDSADQRSIRLLSGW